MMKYLIHFGMVIGLLITSGCSSRQFISEKIVTSEDINKFSKNPEEMYQHMRSKWTVSLSPKDLQSDAASSMGMPRGSQSGAFPVRILATMMDDQVIEAGLNYYASMAKMTSGEADVFRRNYRKEQKTEQYFLIEVSMTTTWVEEYLDLNRWTIYIADDQNNQHEAAKIVERPVVTQQIKRRLRQRGGNRQPLEYTWTNNQKKLLLYFSRKDYYGNPTLHDDLKALKIVFILERGGTGRAEGTWIYKVDYF
jgi:hypothetical protein